MAATVGAGVLGHHSNQQSPPLSQPPLGPPQPAPLRPSDRNSHPSPTLRPPFWSSGGSPLLFHSRKLNTPPHTPLRPARLTRHTGFPHPLPSSAALPFLPPGQGSPPPPTSPARPGASPGGQVRPPLSSRRVSPQTGALPPCLPPQARAPALTELGDVPGHRVVLLAPVQRGRRGTPVALAVRGRSHRARCRRRPDAPPLAALGSAGSQAGSGTARALTACPSRTPSPRGGTGAVSGGARRGNPFHRRRQAARALPAPRPPRERWSFPPPPASLGRAVVGARGQWFSGLPALLRHAPGCMFGAPDNPDAVLCLDVSEPLCVCVWFDF